MTKPPNPVHQAGYRFNLTKIPPDVKGAKDHVLSEVGKLFDMAAECGAEEVLDITFSRKITEEDPFADWIVLSMRVQGKNMTTTVRPIGQVQLSHP